MKSLQERMRIRNEQKEAARLFKTQGLTYKAISYIPIKGAETKHKPATKAELAAVVGECLTHPSNELGAVSRIHITDEVFEQLPSRL